MLFDVYMERACVWRELIYVGNLFIEENCVWEGLASRPVQARSCNGCVLAVMSIRVYTSWCFDSILELRVRYPRKLLAFVWFLKPT